MQIQKLVLGPKFGAHIVEKSNDQGLNIVFVPKDELFTTEDELYSTDWQS